MTSTKLQRWTDLLAALLRRHYPVSFEELAADVPAYCLPRDAATAARESLKRAFERDKAELLAFGIPLETVSGAEGDGYRLRSRDFYLPYLELHDQGRATTTGRHADVYGYRALERLALEPAELTSIATAARRVQELGEPLLASNARSAIAKLAFDLPADSARGDAEIIITDKAVDPNAFRRLSAALLRRKRVTFDYRSMATGVSGSRTAEPLGLFFVNSHWYLAARDGSALAVKNFRLSRMRAVTINARQPQTPDFTVPQWFNLSEHARSRQAWELGDAESTEAIVEFTARTGATLPALEFGRPVPEHPNRRAFTIRRQEVFVRWVLSFGGSARPVAPDSLVQAFHQAVRDTLARYGSPS